MLTRRLRSVSTSSCMLALSGALVLAPAHVRAAEPVVVVPAKPTRKERRQARRERDLSRGGTRRGIIELTLGSLVAAGAVTLVGRGTWELVQGRRLRERCVDSGSVEPECGDENPARDSEIAAGLSFGFAVPLAVASGLLFARGVRIHRDYREFRRNNPELTVIPRASRHGGGLAVRVAF